MIKRIEDIFYYVGLLVSIYGIFKIYMVRSSLPEGACPVDDNRWILITGIIFLAVSIGIGLFSRYKEKKRA